MEDINSDKEITDFELGIHLIHIEEGDCQERKKLTQTTKGVILWEDNYNIKWECNKRRGWYVENEHLKELNTYEQFVYIVKIMERIVTIMLVMRLWQKYKV